MQSSGDFFVVGPNKPSNKQSNCRRCDTPWPSCHRNDKLYLLARAAVIQSPPVGITLHNEAEDKGLGASGMGVTDWTNFLSFFYRIIKITVIYQTTIFSDPHTNSYDWKDLFVMFLFYNFGQVAWPFWRTCVFLNCFQKENCLTT